METSLPHPSLPHLYPDPDSDTQVDPINPDVDADTHTGLDDTVIQRLPRCTIVGMPMPMRPPASASVASYVARYPPKMDDAVVVDVDFDPTGRRVEILSVTQQIEIKK